MPPGKLNLKASKKKVEKLLDRIRTREISVDDIMLFHEWARRPVIIRMENGAKISERLRR
jgi:hypothetical protein